MGEEGGGGGYGVLWMLKGVVVGEWERVWDGEVEERVMRGMDLKVFWGFEEVRMGD